MSENYDVVLPVVPEESFLGEALESVLAQSKRPNKIFVVVNGTNETKCRSFRVAKSFGKPVEAILVQEKGQIGALRLGIASSKSSFIAFIDADDLWLPDKQEVQLGAFQTWPELEAVHCIMTDFRDHNGVRQFGRSTQSALFGATTFRRSVFDRLGPPDLTAKPSQWLVRWYSSAREAGLVETCIDEEMILRRIHGDNFWVNHREEALGHLFEELRHLSRKKLRET